MRSLWTEGQCSTWHTTWHHTTPCKHAQTAHILTRRYLDQPIWRSRCWVTEPDHILAQAARPLSSSHGQRGMATVKVLIHYLAMGDTVPQPLHRRRYGQGVHVGPHGRSRASRDCPIYGFHSGRGSHSSAIIFIFLFSALERNSFFGRFCSNCVRLHLLQHMCMCSPGVHDRRTIKQRLKARPTLNLRYAGKEARDDAQRTFSRLGVAPQRGSCSVCRSLGRLRTGSSPQSKM